MSETTAAAQGTETAPTPKDVAEAAPQGKERVEAPAQQTSNEPDWKSRFDGQKQVNQDLEAKLNQLKDGLKGALGIEDRKSDPAQLVSALQETISQLQQDSLRQRIALDKGLSSKWAGRLRGATEAEMEADADQILADLAAAQAPTTPKPDRTQGGSGAGPALNSDGLEQALRDKLGIA